jgi:hypothetical protein
MSKTHYHGIVTGRGMMAMLGAVRPGSVWTPGGWPGSREKIIIGKSLLWLREIFVDSLFLPLHFALHRAIEFFVVCRFALHARFSVLA